MQSRTPEIDYVVNAISVLGKTLATVVVWLLVATVLSAGLVCRAVLEWWQRRSLSR